MMVFIIGMTLKAMFGFFPRRMEKIKSLKKSILKSFHDQLDCYDVFFLFTIC